MELPLKKKAAVCMDDRNKAFFLKTDAAKTPGTLKVNKPATSSRKGKVIQIAAISAKVGKNKFNMNTFEPEHTTGQETSW
ncbi:MAG: hypothetical protein J7599_11455 [Niabella sp.]|nr:hypothetical protein [Niabella sp.]